MSIQNKIVEDVLREFHKTGILNDVIIVGSWCIHFYKLHFVEGRPVSNITTLDIDLDVNPLRRMKGKVDIPELLKPLDFEINFRSNDSIELKHPDLKMEFLVPEIGRFGSDPVRLEGFGITAQPLRFLYILEKEVISIDYKGMQVQVPHPVNFAVHKLIISQRRGNRKTGAGAKFPKDIQQGVEVLEMALRMGDEEKIKALLNELTKKEKKYVRQALNCEWAEILSPELEKIMETFKEG